MNGDLLDQAVEGIVDPRNRNIIPWGLLLPQGVSRAIKRRGGKDPFRELAEHGPIPPGDAVLNSAGRLPFKSIIHVAAIKVFWRSSETSIRDSVRISLALARNHGFRSIAVSLVGLGSGGGRTEMARDLILQAANASDFPGRIVIVFHTKADSLLSAN